MSTNRQSDGEDSDETQTDRPSSRVSREGLDNEHLDEEAESRLQGTALSRERHNADLDQTSTRPGFTKDDAKAESTSALGLRTEGLSSGISNYVFRWLRKRTIGRGPFVDPARDNFRTMTSLYSSMNPAADSINISTQTYGAVFNLEYSPDG